MWTKEPAPGLVFEAVWFKTVALNSGELGVGEESSLALSISIV